MSTFFGAPLVGKFFTPVMFVFSVVYILMTVARWLKSDGTKIKEEAAATTISTEPLGDVPKQEMTADLSDGDTKKKKKKKKSCCGTKGGCCKTKKDTGDEKKGSCGCGCSSKKEGEKADGSCSSDAEVSDSEDDMPQILDVEELGMMVEGLRPDLASHSPPRPARSQGIPKGRVRLRITDQSKQTANQQNQVPNETESKEL